jgi:hypothetical protein
VASLKLRVVKVVQPAQVVSNSIFARAASRVRSSSAKPRLLAGEFLKDAV